MRAVLSSVTSFAKWQLWRDTKNECFTLMHANTVKFRPACASSQFTVSTSFMDTEKSTSTKQKVPRTHIGYCFEKQNMTTRELPFLHVAAACYIICNIGA